MTEELPYDSVFCDGGTIGHNPSLIGGVWSVCMVHSRTNLRIRQHGRVITPAQCQVEAITNNLAELVAMNKAIWALPLGWSGTIYTDSRLTLGRVFKRWRLTVGVPDWLAEDTAVVRNKLKHLGAFQYVLLKGHPTKTDLKRGFHAYTGLPVNEHQVWCDLMCRTLGEKYLKTLAEEPGVRP